MLLSAAMFVAMMAFPADFSYWPFALVMLSSGVANGLFASPNTSSIMNAVPARHRGAASGMRVTFSNAGMPLSMGLFFTILVLGLNTSVPHALLSGLVAHGVPTHVAATLARTPPLGYLFAAFLGYNPLKSLLGPAVLSHLSSAQAATITSRAFFPALIGPSFRHALVLVLFFAAVMSLIAAFASALRGARYVHEDEESVAQRAALATRQGTTSGAERIGQSAALAEGSNAATGTVHLPSSPVQVAEDLTSSTRHDPLLPSRRSSRN